MTSCCHNVSIKQMFKSPKCSIFHHFRVLESENPASHKNDRIVSVLLKYKYTLIIFSFCKSPKQLKILLEIGIEAYHVPYQKDFCHRNCVKMVATFSFIISHQPHVTLCFKGLTCSGHLQAMSRLCTVHSRHLKGLNRVPDPVSVLRGHRQIRTTTENRSVRARCWICMCVSSKYNVDANGGINLACKQESSFRWKWIRILSLWTQHGGNGTFTHLCEAACNM